MTRELSEEAHSPARGERSLLTLEREVAFDLRVPLPAASARAFVQDVPGSLAQADFLAGVRMRAGDPPTLMARLPVNAAAFGLRDVPFASTVHFTDRGATLTPVEPDAPERAWAEVGGEAHVEPLEGGSRLVYALTITVHLLMPRAEHWGSHALLRMIEFTAASVLRNVGERFPKAVQSAAASVEAALAEPARVV